MFGTKENLRKKHVKKKIEIKNAKRVIARGNAFDMEYVLRKEVKGDVWKLGKWVTFIVSSIVWFTRIGARVQ